MAPAERRSPFLRRLRGALIADVEPELELACRIAELSAEGKSREAIAAELDEPPAAVRAARRRLHRVAPGFRPQ